MPRIVPSTVVKAIETEFYGIVVQNSVPDIRETDAFKLHAILIAISEIPDYLLPDNPMELWTHRAYLQAATEKAIQVYRTNQGAFPKQPMTSGALAKPVLRAIWDILSSCRDERPAPSTHELRFITDNDFRHALRTDITSVNTALGNGEWKAATVLAGSVVEALLLWALENMRPLAERRLAITRLHSQTSGLPRHQQIPSTLPDDLADLQWNLYRMVAVSGELNLIEKTTITEADLCRDFRNLIHPAKASRQGACDRGTALTAVGAVEHVIRDLS